MTIEEVIAKMDAVERAASDLVRLVKETRQELYETLDRDESDVVD